MERNTVAGTMQNSAGLLKAAGLLTKNQSAMQGANGLRQMAGLIGNPVGTAVNTAIGAMNLPGWATGAAMSGANAALNGGSVSNAVTTGALGAIGAKALYGLNPAVLGVNMLSGILGGPTMEQGIQKFVDAVDQWGGFSDAAKNANAMNADVAAISPYGSPGFTATDARTFGGPVGPSVTGDPDGSMTRAENNRLGIRDAPGWAGTDGTGGAFGGSFGGSDSSDSGTGNGNGGGSHDRGTGSDRD